ncbi:MAG: hypothetical protein JO146_06365, partial [Candidatus Eremiobacteraeota bacterium]|nr:hypothetical protein [Candidatus Eremiobacteraeota bacterium]
MESRTRRRVSGMLVASLLGAICAVGIAHGAAGRAEQSGVFALLGGTPRVSAKFWVSSPEVLSGTSASRSLSATLKVRQFGADGKPVLNYDVDMEHTMHMIVVRDDFATFAHVHPNFDPATGTFSQEFTREPNRRYYVYADSTPHGLPQQVFRFMLGGPGPLADSRLVFAPSDPAAEAGPYNVTLSHTTIVAAQPHDLDLTVLENGRPAQNLAPYLGAAAHVVLINTVSLAYVHLHPALRGTDDEHTSMSAGMNMAESTE